MRNLASVLPLGFGWDDTNRDGRKNDALLLPTLRTQQHGLTCFRLVNNLGLRVHAWSLSCVAICGCRCLRMRSMESMFGKRRTPCVNSCFVPHFRNQDQVAPSVSPDQFRYTLVDEDQWLRPGLSFKHHSPQTWDVTMLNDTRCSWHNTMPCKGSFFAEHKLLFSLKHCFDTQAPRTKTENAVHQFWDYIKWHQRFQFKMIR